MKAEDIAKKAASLVSGEREDQHGDKFVNFGNIAILWNAFLAIRDRQAPTPVNAYTPPLRGEDVAKMMALLKLARMESGAHNPDDAIDFCGYAAIAGELSSPGIEDTEPFPVKTFTPMGTKR